MTLELAINFGKNRNNERPVTHMLHFPTIVFLAHEQDQLETGDNCSSGENHISLVQASQIPVRSLKFQTSLNPLESL